MKILIVEDEALTALAFKRLLNEHNHQIVGMASRASTAIEIIEEKTPNLVLLDINLKHQGTNEESTHFDGIDVCKWIKSRSNSKILVVSAYASTEPTKTSLREAGIDIALTKPINDIDLLQAIESLSK